MIIARRRATTHKTGRGHSPSVEPPLPFWFYRVETPSPDVCLAIVVAATGVLLSSDPDVCFALRDGFLHHGPRNGAVVVGDGLTHALHGDVRRIGRVRAQTEDN
jgi:hypothetical protein